MNHDVHDHDRGLAFDLATLGRRRALLLLGGAGLAALVGCTTGSTNNGSATTAAGATTTTADGTSCGEIAGETAGPFPGDGSNGPNILAASGIVRSDIRSSFGSAAGVAQGVPLTINLAVVDATSGCAALAGAAVYLWHCDADGNYSMYSQGVENENFLRGVQEADQSGRLSFTSIFPGAYAGRWPHIHFEVYASLDDATGAGDPIVTSQIALPAETCQEVYDTDGYDGSARNLSQSSLDSDNVFSDGYASQLATVTGEAARNLTAALTVAV